MKSSFIRMITGLIIGVSVSSLVLAADTTGSSTTEAPLILDTITTQDDAHILVSFNQNIVAEAVRVRISKQSDGSNVKVEKVTSVVEAPKSVLVSLSDILGEGSTYTLTVLSAISEGGVVIKEGADASKEFTTPIPLKKSILTFNAPANPNAAIASTGSAPAVEALPVTASGKEAAKTEPTAKELPLTGMNPILFLIIAWGLALAFIVRRKA